MAAQPSQQDPRLLIMHTTAPPIASPHRSKVMSYLTVLLLFALLGALTSQPTAAFAAGDRVTTEVQVKRSILNTVAGAAAPATCGAFIGGDYRGPLPGHPDVCRFKITWREPGTDESAVAVEYFNADCCDSDTSAAGPSLKTVYKETHVWSRDWNVRVELEWAGSPAPMLWTVQSGWIDGGSSANFWQSTWLPQVHLKLDAA